MITYSDRYDGKNLTAITLHPEVPGEAVSAYPDLSHGIDGLRLATVGNTQEITGSPEALEKFWNALHEAGIKPNVESVLRETKWFTGANTNHSRIPHFMMAYLNPIPVPIEKGGLSQDDRWYGLGHREKLETLADWLRKQYPEAEVTGGEGISIQVGFSRRLEQSSSNREPDNRLQEIVQTLEGLEIPVGHTRW